MDKNIVNDPSCFIGLPHMKGRIFSNWGYLNMSGELKKNFVRKEPATQEGSEPDEEDNKE